MKSIKKRFKLLLNDIAASAEQLAVISADLTLLSEIQEVAVKVLRGCATLVLVSSALKKDDFLLGICDSQALAEMEELTDIDAISVLEERLFSAVNNQDDQGAGEFLQQFLEKVDKCYTQMLTDIQQLMALLDEGEEE
jgi:hypothetical protein